MNKEKFEQQTKERRQKNIEQLTVLVLTKMLDDDLRVFDTHYICNRTTQIIEETIKKLNFKNETIEKARKAFLDVLIDGMQNDPYTMDDEFAEAKKHIRSKDKDKKFKAIECIKAIERIKAGNPQTATEQRDMECEPVCQFISKQLLSKEWLLKDKDYVKGQIELDDERLILVNAVSQMNVLFDMIYNSIDESHSRANEKFWGCQKEKIRLKQLDNILKE